MQPHSDLADVLLYKDHDIGSLGMVPGTPPYLHISSGALVTKKGGFGYRKGEFGTKKGEFELKKGNLGPNQVL